MRPEPATDFVSRCGKTHPLSVDMSRFAASPDILLPVRHIPSTSTRDALVASHAKKCPAADRPHIGFLFSLSRSMICSSRLLRVCSLLAAK